MISFQAGGWGMFPTAIFGLLLAATSFRYAMNPEKRWVPLLVSMNVLTLVSGLLGFVTGMISTARYFSERAPEQPSIVLVGLGESLHNVSLALALMALAAMATAVGALRASRVPSL